MNERGPDIQFLSEKPMLGYGTTEVRCVQPAAFLAVHGWRTATGCITRDMPRARQVLVLHRVGLSPTVERAVTLARAAGCRILYDVDDLIFDADGRDHLWHAGGAAGRGGDARSAPEARYAAAMRLADRVTCATDYLQQRAARIHPHVTVMRNAVSAAFVAAAASQPGRPAGESVTLAYLSGSAHHDADFRLLEPVLLEMLAQDPRVRLLIAGKLEVAADFTRFGARFERIPFMPYAAFRSLFGRIDINLVPLDTASPFAQARSELKYLEAGAFGIPTVAAPTDAYSHAIRHGQNGLLCQTPAEWAAALRQLVEAPALRARLGAAARADVLAHHGPEIRAQQWDELIRDLLAQPPVPGPVLADAPVRLQAARHRLDLLRERARRQIRGLTSRRSRS